MRNTLFYRLSFLLPLAVVAGCALPTPPATAPSTTSPVASMTPEVTLEAAQDSPVSTAEPTGTPEPAAQEVPAEGVSQVAERVEFEAGAPTATVSGTLPTGGEISYAFTGVADQTVHIQSVGYSAPVSFTVYAPNGTSWVGEPQAAGVHIFTAQMTLPETGDYLVTLSVPADATETTFDLTFTLAANVQPMTPQPGAAERIFVDPQSGLAERSGLMPTGLGVQQYVLSLNSGQTLTVDATSDGAPLSMTIESPTGNQWIPEMMETEEGYTIGIQFELPEPGYYLVTLTKGDHTPSTNYTITFSLQP